MSRSIRRRRGFPILCAVLLAVALPVSGLMLRPAVLFLANFNAPGDGGSLGEAPIATVGDFDDMGASGAFVVEVDAQGNGRLRATNSENTSVLRGTLEDPASQSSRVSASIFVKPERAVGHFYVRLSDEGDTPLIDVEFTPAGDITVAGNVVMNYVPKVGYDVAISLNDPIIGPTSASVVISGDNGDKAGVSGIPIHWLDLSVGSIDLVLPATEFQGEFLIDDVLVTSPDTLYAPAGSGANAK